MDDEEPTDPPKPDQAPAGDEMTDELGEVAGGAEIADAGPSS